MDPLDHLRNAAPQMLLALEAHQAWHWAEENHTLSTFDERMELCNYANYLTSLALALVEGKSWDEAYNGVPHMIVWPTINIFREDSHGAQLIVDRLLSEWKKSVRRAEE